MKVYIVILLLALFVFKNVQCQNDDNMIQNGKLWVLVKKEKMKSNDQKIGYQPESKIVLEIFNKYKVHKMKKAFPFSKNEILQRVYSIYFDSETLPFVAELATNTTEEFERIIERPKEEKIALYEPSDYMWQIDMGTWHLKNINADDAWDITKGSDDVKIAILDTWFDINHPDLENKIYPSYDPYDLTYFNTDCARNNHGTTVASFAAAETDGGGQLSSVGFDCLIIGYQAQDGDYIERAHHASLAMDADVLTSSAGGWNCRSSSMVDSIEQLAVEEIIANGTVIVMPAGNGINGIHCNYGPWFPLHPVYDSNIIIVTSIGIDNKHYLGADTHSHYGEVDICAPGYYVMGARCTEKNNCDPGVCCIPETWPYYGSCIGTSFATPIVAGTVGLMKSIYPCLNQEEAQRIIKSTANPAEDGSSYPGQIGTGIIDAYQCVLATTELATVNYTDTVLSSSQTTNAFYGIEFDNVSLTGGTHNFNARQELKIIGPFQIDVGVSCTFNVDEALSVSCN